jgi:glycosyltransferase involved in cell wall biosynthesis
MSRTASLESNEEFVSILMLTYNAPEYVEISVRSVRERTRGVRYELVVLDNDSQPETKALVQRLHDEGLIDKLRLLDRNSLFAEGNNLASEMADPAATHYLLLNSDIEAHDPDWLRHLLDEHQRGITAYGVAPDPDRVDGYCLLIDADLYRRYKLDEGHQWWWAVTKMQALVLSAGFPVRGFAEHEQYLHHFGGKSGSGFKNAKGMNVSREEVLGWFADRRPVVLDRNADGSLPGPRHVPVPEAPRSLLSRARGRLRRLLESVTTH